MEKRVETGKREKILIIKTGYSEVLDTSIGKVSLGDVLRTTPLLHFYKDDDVTWLTDKEALPLLEENPYINHLLTLDFVSAINLLDEEFDAVVNLEKNPEICKLSNKIEAWKKYGFRFDKKTNRPQAYDRALEVLTVSSDIRAKKENNKHIQELLFGMVGAEWDGEEYILSYKPKTKEVFDIGLNVFIGPKWPTKSWPVTNWDILENILTRKGYTVTRQDKQGEGVTKNLYGYMDWINSSNLLVTNDSLGLHIGLAFKKRIIGLFGASSKNEVYFYGRGEAILPEPIPDCLPCFNSVCEKDRNCMEDINPERVVSKIENYINKKI
jgi:heptosyltransferase-2